MLFLARCSNAASQLNRKFCSCKPIYWLKNGTLCSSPPSGRLELLCWLLQTNAKWHLQARAAITGTQDLMHWPGVPSVTLAPAGRLGVGASPWLVYFLGNSQVVKSNLNKISNYELWVKMKRFVLPARNWKPPQTWLLPTMGGNILLKTTKVRPNKWGAKLISFETTPPEVQGDD